MKAATGFALVLVLAAGCGVSNKQYLSQVTRGEELQARLAAAEARLDEERAAREAAEAAVEDERGNRERAEASVADLSARAAELEAGLKACQGREEALRADLDLCGKARAAAEEKLAEAVRERRQLQGAWADERAAIEARLDGCRDDLAAREARLSVIAEEKRRAEQEKREKLDEVSRTYAGLLAGLQEEVEKGRVTIQQLQGKLSVNVLDEILFDSGSAAIKEGGREVLRQLSEALSRVEGQGIVIEGHTDDVPITGALSQRFHTNWELSAARATAVVRYLQEQGGVPGDRLSAVGFGPYRPVDTNDTPEGRARNRRIEIKLVPLDNPVLAVPRPAEPPPAEPGEDPAD